MKNKEFYNDKLVAIAISGKVANGTWTPGGGEWDDSVPVDEPATGDTPPWNDLPKCPDGEQRICPRSESGLET